MKKVLTAVPVIILLLLTACDKANQKFNEIISKTANVVVNNNGTCIVDGVRLKYSGIVTIKPDYSSGEIIFSESVANMSFIGITKGDSIQVYYREFAPNDAIISIKGSNFQVTTKSGKPALITSIKGYIPSELKLNLTTGSGDIQLENMQGNAKLLLNASSGDLTLSNCSSQAASLQSSSGDIALSGCTITELNAIASSGDLTLTNCSSQAVSLKSSSGDINIRNSRIEHVSGQTSSGDVNISNSQIKERKFSTSSGEVNG